MSARLLSDLEAWESGQLELSEVEARHPRADVSGLVHLHEVMSDAGSHPMPASAESWERLKKVLPDRVAPPLQSRRESPHRWIRRPVLVATATMLLGGSALAMTSEPVREGVQDVLRTVASLVNLDVGDSSDSGITPRETSAGEPGGTGSGNGTTGRDQGRGDEPDHARGRTEDAKGRGRAGRGPNTEHPSGPNSLPGAAGKGDSSSTGNTPPVAGGNGGASGKPDGAGKPEGSGKPGDAGKPDGSGSGKGKDQQKSGAEATPDDSGPGKGAEKPANPEKPDDPVGGSGNSGGNGNVGNGGGGSGNDAGVEGG
jgi:hypothetical protein